jgi:hypothetical protein
MSVEVSRAKGRKEGAALILWSTNMPCAQYFVDSSGCCSVHSRTFILPRARARPSFLRCFLAGFRLSAFRSIQLATPSRLRRLRSSGGC